jgi:hypothetical protein
MLAGAARLLGCDRRVVDFRRSEEKSVRCSRCPFLATTREKLSVRLSFAAPILAHLLGSEVVISLHNGRIEQRAKREV